MNINSLFNLFNNDYNDPQNDESSLLVDFSEHPLYWISGYNKVISNHKFFTKYTAKMFKEVDPELDLEEIEKVGEQLMFDKAWNYIKHIKIDNPFHVDCLKTKKSDEFIDNLIMTIKFYESLEEYEKCAHLKNIENKLKELTT